MSFLTELRRRNVYKVAAAYIVVAWLLIQVATQTFPVFEIPNWVARAVILLLCLGFPVAMVLAWTFELTPEGFKRESEVVRSQSTAHFTGKRLDYIIMTLLLVAIGLFVADRFVSDSAPPAAMPPVASEATVATPSPAAPVSTQPVAAATPNEKSIAVLPFVDMSVEKNQEYMSDGIAEELLNRLAQVPDLKVIARTSSFAFKTENVGIAEIGQQLNVAHVLEGGVRKSGNKVRITAQLIRTADSTHLWSESYDRAIDDIFAVQDEIAGAIVQTLQIQLRGGQLSPRKGGTKKLEAYELYLRAVSAVNQNTRSSLKAADEYLEQAISLDASYGLAWSRLAAAFMVKADNGWVDSTEGYGRARELAQHALQLSPDLAEAHAFLAYVYQTLNWDWAAAEQEGQRALAIDPTNADALNISGKLAAIRGRWNDAEQQYRAALARDPLNTYVIFNLGHTYYLAGRFAEAESTQRKLLKLEPDFLWTCGALAKTLLAQGKPEDALTMAQQNKDEAERLAMLPIFLRAAGRQAEADEALKAQVAQWADTGAYFVAMTYAHRGDHDLALQWLERAYQQRDATLVEIVGETLFKNIANDSRYKAFLRKMNLPE